MLFHILPDFVDENGSRQPYRFEETGLGAKGPPSSIERSGDAWTYSRDIGIIELPSTAGLYRLQLLVFDRTALRRPIPLKMEVAIERMIEIAD